MLDAWAGVTPAERLLPALADYLASAKAGGEGKVAQALAVAGWPVTMTTPRMCERSRWHAPQWLDWCLQGAA